MLRHHVVHTAGQVRATSEVRIFKSRGFCQLGLTQSVDAARLEKLARKGIQKAPETESRSAWQNQFANRRVLFQEKNKPVDNWTVVMYECRDDSKSLWSKLRRLLQFYSVGFGWLVDEVVWACAIVVLSVDVDI